jgi:hypothetical protein
MCQGSPRTIYAADLRKKLDRSLAAADGRLASVRTVATAPIRSESSVTRA